MSVSGPLTSMEELFSGSKPFLVSTRNCRRLSENVINLLSSISLTRSSVDASLGNDSSMSGASIIPLTPVPPSVAPTVVPTSGLMPNPFSPGWAANTLMVNEDYRWDTTGQVFGLLRCSISIKHMEINVLLCHDKPAAPYGFVSIIYYYDSTHLDSPESSTHIWRIDVDTFVWWNLLSNDGEHANPPTTAGCRLMNKNGECYSP